MEGVSNVGKPTVQDDQRQNEPAIRSNPIQTRKAEVSGQHKFMSYFSDEQKLNCFRGFLMYRADPQAWRQGTVESTN